MISNEMWNLFLTLGLGGFITSMVYYIWGVAEEYIQRRMITSVAIDNMDPTYKWVLQFLTEKGFLADQMQDAIVRKVQKKKNWWVPQAKEKPKVEYYPAPGLHYFTFRGKKMWAVQNQGKINLVGWENKPEVSESIVIMCYGGTMTHIQSLIDEAVIYSMDQDKGLLGIYQVLGWSCFWVKVMTKKARSLDSVVLDTDIAETLTKDIEDF